MTGRREQAEEDRQTGQVEQAWQNRYARTGLPGQVCQDRSARTGLPGQNCHEWAARTRLLTDDSLQKVFAPPPPIGYFSLVLPDEQEDLSQEPGNLGHHLEHGAAGNHHHGLLVPDQPGLSSLLLLFNKYHMKHKELFNITVIKTQLKNTRILFSFPVWYSIFYLP